MNHLSIIHSIFSDNAKWNSGKTSGNSSFSDIYVINVDIKIFVAGLPKL